ncbi:MAG TPA: regulatory iron-sulfur-containing complex subunit RicT [Myxococcota bacterium]|nr:regulatory iron-sulfur-containing complex subunit RicT [Myxococcota bacterium]HPV03217.1 regulatory iron-sulfur-containing complex subunit RicT [Myxococcota bacterium]
MENKENLVVPVSEGQSADVATLAGSGGVIAEIGWIRFPKSGKQALAGAGGHQFRSGDLLLVRTERGDIYARALTDSARKVFLPAEFFEVVDVLSREEATAALKRDEARELEARRVFVELVRKHELDMHLSEVEITHGDARIVFNFTSPGRVDFRSLVRELAGALKSRIELRQIGVRDETRCTGGLGPCGLSLCCATFLREFTTVTIRMAKVQGLVPNPQKVSGLCGRLMCCLAYEHGVYTDMMKDLPRNGTTIKTPKGEGRVKEVLVMRNVIKVALGPGVVEDFTFEQLGISAARGCGCSGGCIDDGVDEAGDEGAPVDERDAGEPSRQTSGTGERRDRQNGDRNRPEQARGDNRGSSQGERRDPGGQAAGSARQHGAPQDRQGRGGRRRGGQGQ